MRMIIANIAIVITPNKNNALLLLKTSFISTNDIFKSSCVTLSFNGENPNKNPVITDAKIYNTRHTSKALSIVPIILIGKTLYEKTVTDNLAISNIIKNYKISNNSNNSTKSSAQSTHKFFAK